jgi:hypothetical protein
LGGLIAKQPSQATHLVVDNLERTFKLLACMNYADFVVGIDWLLDSIKTETFLGDYSFKMNANCMLPINQSISLLTSKTKKNKKTSDQIHSIHSVH